MDDIQVRREILQLLYTVHKRGSPRVMEEDEMVNRLNLSSRQISSNLLYLSEKGLIQIQTTSATGSRIYHFVRITSNGIDLVDDPNEFNERFPPVIFIHNEQVGGDKIQVSTGDHVSNVIVGKDINAAQTGRPISPSSYETLQIDQGYGLKEALDCFVAFLENHLAAGRFDREAIWLQLNLLQETLNSGEIDLGEIQRVKRFLSQLEDAPLEGTTALFSHPAVMEPVRRAVADLLDSAQKEEL